MAGELFRAIPKVSYNGVQTRNIILRAGLAAEAVERYGVFYPYTVRDGERPDTVAHDYYGDSNYSWLVYIANGVVDPWTDWVLSYPDFVEYLVDKYGSLEAAQSTVHHWKSEDADYVMSPETHALLTAPEKVGFDVSVDCYTWEDGLNEGRRSIRLLSRRYADQAMRELESVFSGARS